MYRPEPGPSPTFSGPARPEPEVQSPARPEPDKTPARYVPTKNTVPTSRIPKIPNGLFKNYTCNSRVVVFHTVRRKRCDKIFTNYNPPGCRYCMPEEGASKKRNKVARREKPDFSLRINSLKSTLARRQMYTLQ